jgi:hypothetical protein
MSKDPDPSPLFKTLYHFKSNAYAQSNKAMYIYKNALISYNWDNEPFNSAILAHDEWVKLKEFIDNNRYISSKGEFCWDDEEEQTTRMVNNWKTVIDDYNNGAIPPENYQTSLNNYPYYKIILEGNKFKILQTMCYDMPFIRIEINKWQYEYVANQLIVSGTKENMSLLKAKITKEIGKLRTYDNGTEGILTLNNFKIVDFPAQDIKELLNEYLIQYSFNAISWIDD